MVFITRGLDEADLVGMLMLMTAGLDRFILDGADGLAMERGGGLIPDR